MPKTISIVADGLEIIFLIEALGGDAAFEGRNKNGIQKDGFQVGFGVLAHDPQGILHILASDGIAGLEQIVQALEGPDGQAQALIRDLPG